MVPATPASTISLNLLLSVAVLLGVFLLLLLRRGGRPVIPIWAVFIVASAFVLAFGLVTPEQAVASIDLQVILFLFCMFVISKGLELSGDLEAFSTWLVARSRGGLKTYALFAYAFGVASAFIMNDSLAIMGTPVVLSYARKAGRDPRSLLYVVAFAVSLGSAMTPIGNPQNTIIALESGLRSPFFDLLAYVAPVSLLGLGALALLSRLLFGRGETARVVVQEGTARDRGMSRAARVGLALAVAGIMGSDLLRLSGVASFTVAEGAVPGALFLLTASRRRFEVLRKLDWRILLMFVGLFVYARGVSNGGLFSSLLPGTNALGGQSLLLTILISSLLLSQLVSNVPAVLLLMPYFRSLIPAGSALYWSSFAAASTFAGVLTTLGAASNLIVIEQAEKEGVRISYLDFLKYGVPVAAACFLILLSVFWLYTVL